MLLGDAVAFAFGFTWLLVVANIIIQSGAALPKWLDATNLLATAWNGAIAPFILWDVLKMAFAALSIVGAWKLLSRKSEEA
jgi:biotin transport system substrate-specific component